MDYKEFEKKISYSFNKKSLIKKALNHTSSHKNNKSGKKNKRENITLEFIGDAVLELASREYLLKKYKTLSVGDISKIKTRMVSDKTLSFFAKKINLDKFVKIAKTKEPQRRNMDAVLAATMEAVIGAIFFDSGLESAKKFVRYKIFLPFTKNKDLIREDFKSIFQEKYQKIYKKPPEYFVVDEKGPPHNKTFIIELIHSGQTLGRGIGKTKKEAEQKAAEKALTFFKKK
ncbi:MAG: ribonuclease III [Candidatus Schekmanbacteria bacterium]|nr:MAG: ribonuclease III [Candidatus Schekmanbacteria bacterium]